jgi:hypothetical protein
MSETDDQNRNAQPDAPDWLEVRCATSPVVVVAPHGGRRTRPIRRSDGMNDLHTAELAIEVAERLDAQALINRGCDRNDVDLNRIRQLISKAPFFLARLRSCVDDLVASGERPLILLIHGWNMAVPWCDVGVGIRERGGQLYGRFPTVGRERYESFVEPLSRRLFDVGLGASVGLRYPAAGGDNATQLFSGRHVEHGNDDVAGLAALGANDQVDAVQLELGIPLRWPGWRREAFIDALVAAVTEEEPEEAARAPARSARSHAWGLEHKAPRPEIEPDAGCSIQAPLADGAGIFMGAEPTGAATMAARLCIALADGSMLLFVGEGPWQGRAGDYGVAGFCWKARAEDLESNPSEATVELSGPLVHYRSHEAFVDLEKGLCDSTVVDADIHLEYAAVSANYGKLTGWVRAGEIERRIDVWAICRRGGRRPTGPAAGVDVYMNYGGDPPVRLSDSRSDQKQVEEVAFTEPVGNVMARIEVSRDGRSLVDGEMPVRVPVYRTLPEGRVVCVTFGTLRIPGETAVGVYERIEVFDPPPSASAD